MTFPGTYGLGAAIREANAVPDEPEKPVLRRSYRGTRTKFLPTRVQYKVLRSLKEYVANRGTIPSLAELAEINGFRSLATIHKHISNLEAKGYLQRSKHGRIVRVAELEPTGKCEHCGRG